MAVRLTKTSLRALTRDDNAPIRATKVGLKALTRDDAAPIRITKVRVMALVPVASATAIELGHIASTLVLYGPTPLVAVAPGYIASGAVLYDPTVGSTGVELALIASTLVLYDPALLRQVSPGFIASGAVLYAPIPASSITLPHIGAGATVGDPALLVGILLGTIAGASALYPFVLGSAANVSGTLYNTGGYELFTGTVTITSPQMKFGAITYRPGSAMYRVTNGALNVDLIPNVGATPVGTKYRVIFHPKQTAGKAVFPWLEEWTVHTTGFLDLSDVRGQ